MGVDWTDTVNAWSDGLGIEYNVITNVDTNDVGFQFQGKEPFLRGIMLIGLNLGRNDPYGMDHTI